MLYNILKQKRGYCYAAKTEIFKRRYNKRRV